MNFLKIKNTGHVNVKDGFIKIIDNNIDVMRNIAFKLIDSYGDGWDGGIMFVDEDLDPENKNEIKFELASGSEETVVKSLDTAKLYKIYFIDAEIHKIFIIDDDTTKEFNVFDSTNPYTLSYQNDNWEIVQ